jgi:hypothetical protein
MSLPNTSSIVEPHHVYPDRVLVSFSYRTTGIPTWNLFRSILIGQGFTGSNRLLARNFYQEGFPNPIRVTASFVPYRTPTAIFTAYLNALADIHDHAADYGDEVTRAYLEPHLRGQRELNWLHGEQVDDGLPQRIISHLWERVMLLETQVLDVARSLVRGGPFAGTASLSAMKFSLVELCADLRTFDPHFCLRRIAPRFKARFNRVVGNRYGSSSAGYADLFADANMIRGYRTAGEFYKAYEKTNRRIRLECTMSKAALSRRSGGRAFRDEMISERCSPPCPRTCQHYSIICFAGSDQKSMTMARSPS